MAILFAASQPGERRQASSLYGACAARSCNPTRLPEFGVDPDDVGGTDRNSCATTGAGRCWHPLLGAEPGRGRRLLRLVGALLAQSGTSPRGAYRAYCAFTRRSTFATLCLRSRRRRLVLHKDGDLLIPHMHARVPRRSTSPGRAISSCRASIICFFTEDAGCAVGRDRGRSWLALAAVRRSRAPLGDGALHGHRRVHRPRRRPSGDQRWRDVIEDRMTTSCASAHYPAPRAGDQDDGRRLSRLVRRSGAGDPLRRGSRRARPHGSAYRSAPAFTRASATSSAMTSPGLAVNIGARVGALAGAGRGARLTDRQGPRRGVRASSSRTAGRTRSRACRASGASMRRRRAASPR